MDGTPAQVARAELSNEEQTVSARGATWRSEKQYAASFLGALPAVSTRKVLEVLATAPDAPCKLAHVLTTATTDAVGELGNAVDRHPAQFRQWARRQIEWPVLRAVNTKGGKRDPFPALAEQLSLGIELMKHV